LIHSVLNIQNLSFYQRFRKENDGIKRKYGEAYPTKKLWHGTSIVDPLLILNTEAGLNVSFSKPGGSYGTGIYFAENAAYSCPSFSYRIPGKVNRFQVLLCDVIVGRSYLVQNVTPASKVLKTPPLIEGKGIYYDSVKGNRANSDIYVVY
jgi:hypothetical protein